MQGVELDPLQARTRPTDVAPWENGTLRNEGNEMDVDEEKGNTTSSTGTLGDGSQASLEAIPAPGLPSLSAQIPASPRPPTQHPAPEYSFGRKCGQSRAPELDQTK